ncbi:SO_0444 family Cu/Zn efflux transporter [Thalassotalea sp. LPB0316]|uniref:SO_0444 family Cu/Zn efflux transporter n=1 Tax=Thalassotalea sp. LPB0316 TaxID=2769490 RepID=UPI001865ED96|nr:SO_0444 family Cu/Zn efflux transporter [Thalassotalea sp. LPB0316]QOL26887.1 SO_0444 family Cu/Zn efflux transporter [Thalassotalea sp. LPB0316]
MGLYQSIVVWLHVIDQLLSNLITLTNDASPWLLLGLLIAGLMHAWLPADLLKKHLSKGKMAIVKAAFIGAPLPLCSCGVIPVATELKRSGASNSATSSFLVATPETGVDSITVSYAMLGPIFAIYRPIAAISSAIITGFLVLTDRTHHHKNSEKVTTSACCGNKTAAPELKKSCCSSTPPPPTPWQKTLSGVKYAATKLIDDLIVWLVIGLCFATLIKTFVPESFLLSYGSGLPAMLLIIAISIPMYICATASTPIAAGFIMAGISPGTALVFMMAGPATNISTLGVIKREMGTGVLTKYLLGVAVSAILFGTGLDLLLTWQDINIAEQMSHSHQVVSPILAYSCSIILMLLAIKPVRKLFLKA